MNLLTHIAENVSATILLVLQATCPQPSLSSGLPRSADRLRVPGIPPSVEWIQTAPHFEITKNGIVITAGEKTDKFITPDGAYVADSAPRVLFEADPDFIFSACVRPTFKTTWDAGALFVEADATHWIKLTFERDDRGRHRVTSTVVQGTSDDCASIEIAGDQTYFRIARKDALVGLYASRNGKFWQPIRTFAFTMKVPLKVGFLAQCPEGGHTQVTFSSIHYEAKRIQNLWGSE